MTMLPLALTMGEPAGIGGEIALKAWFSKSGLVPPFFVIDDPARLRQLAMQLRLDIPVIEIAAPKMAVAVFREGLPVLPHALAERSVPGKPSPANAAAVAGAIERGVDFALSGDVAAVVTNPVHKETLYAGGFAHPGHTEFLAELAKRRVGKSFTPVMMLASQELRVVPVTVHQALRDVPVGLTTSAIIACGKITAESLMRDFGIRQPRLAVAGLNPHAGEGGALGNEEQTVIAPAIAELRSLGIAATGPFAADTLFHEAARKTYDAALCMYHDQALIPIKTLAFDSAVNVTLGLPFIRTSPDHGTAFDIAGLGKARESSLIAALVMADAMAKRRGSHDGRARVA